MMSLYDKWVEFTEESLQQADMKEAKILDVACGTGNVTLPLIQKGYDVIGVDLSEEMLAVAQQKLGEAGYFIPFTNKICGSLMFQVSLTV